MSLSPKHEEEIAKFSEMCQSGEFVPVEEIVELPEYFKETTALIGRRKPIIPVSTEFRPRPVTAGGYPFPKEEPYPEGVKNLHCRKAMESAFKSTEQLASLEDEFLRELKGKGEA